MNTVYYKMCVFLSRRSHFGIRTLLLVLLFLKPSPALIDPCVNHTVLNQAWRSIDCTETECSRQLKCDNDLVTRWYRFESSGGWKLPETAVPDYHCSTERPGWLNGSHPTVGQEEVTRTVCFNWAGNRCYSNREIKIKNCSSFLVYELKSTPDCSTAYCTANDSAVSNPCVDHAVLNQPWRSMDCNERGCSGPKCDDKLRQGWYRFQSFGGWQIPETKVTEGHCSTKATGWLEGSHPTMEQGIVTRTVCFSWNGNPCNWVHEIKIKNCNSYFVYELKSLHKCAAYCTDPHTTRTPEPEEQTTREYTDTASAPPPEHSTSGAAGVEGSMSKHEVRIENRRCSMLGCRP
ncbi:uncharacterized protein LOC144510056 [Mustelus asterias]